MKFKILILSIALTSLSLLSFSQEQKKFAFGVKGGVNLSNIIFRTEQKNLDGNFKPSFQIGAFSKIYIRGDFWIVPELMFSSQGMNDSITITGTDGFPTGPYKIMFIENTIILPILIKYYPTDNLSLFTGPQVDYLFLMKAKENYEELPDHEGEYVSDFNYGVLIGAGFDITSKIGIEAHYNYGFNRFDKSGRESGLRRHNSVWMLNLNYTFQ